MSGHTPQLIRALAQDADTTTEVVQRVLEAFARQARRQGTRLPTHLFVALPRLLFTQEVLGITTPLTEDHHRCIEALLDELQVDPTERDFAREQLQRVAYHTYDLGCDGIRAFLDSHTPIFDTTILTLLRQLGPQGLDVVLTQMEVGPMP